MRLLCSGEGPTDIGRCGQWDHCNGADFDPGPMAWLADQVAESRLQFSLVGLGMMHALSKQALQQKAKSLKPPRLRGRNRPAETAYYFRNARALACAAVALSAQLEDDVVAILFRDADGTQSAGRGQREDKLKSMLAGFAFEGFARGVPMIPQPKSEAWLLCALKPKQPYQHCDSLEAASGNDRAPNALKHRLAAALGYAPSAVELAQLVQGRHVDALHISMKSFLEFRERLEAVI